MHASSTPPTFVLSQDQTLHFDFVQTEEKGCPASRYSDQVQAVDPIHHGRAHDQVIRSWLDLTSPKTSSIEDYVSGPVHLRTGPLGCPECQRTASGARCGAPGGPEQRSVSRFLAVRGAGNSSDSRRDRKRRGKISSRALGRTHNRLRGSVLRCGRIAAPAEDVRLGAAGASLGRILVDPVASARPEVRLSALRTRQRRAAAQAATRSTTRSSSASHCPSSRG